MQGFSTANVTANVWMRCILDVINFGPCVEAPDSTAKYNYRESSTVKSCTALVALSLVL